LQDIQGAAAFDKIAVGHNDLAHDTSFSRLLAAIRAVLDQALEKMKVRFGRAHK